MFSMHIVQSCEKRIDDHVIIELLLFKNRTCFKLTILGQL
jgi:hypothetical protein